MGTISSKVTIFDRESLFLAVISVGIGWACFACLMVASYRVMRALL
jgi:hypothetical protein